jgi:hypothetical protein
MRENAVMATKRFGSFFLHGSILLLGSVNRLVSVKRSKTNRTLLVVRTDGLGDFVLLVSALGVSGSTGVMLAVCFALMPSCVLWPFQVRYLLRGDALGIWGK